MKRREEKKWEKKTHDAKKNKSVFISSHFRGKMCVEMATVVRKNDQNDDDSP